jgi:hypothetical protein
MESAIEAFEPIVVGGPVATPLAAPAADSVRPYPESMIAVMHDYAQINPVDFPKWGTVGSWMWWAWKNIETVPGAYAWLEVENYLKAAEALGKKVALSILLYPGPNMDCTPQHVYGVGGKGWEGTNAAGQTFTYPKWNDPTWDNAYRNLVQAFGTRFDGDPRIHSIWIATLLYGETVITQPDGGALGHNPIQFVLNAIDWHDQAFPKTPLFIMNTGNTSRLDITNYALARGVDIKLNGLCKDLANHVQVKPVPGSGLVEVAQVAMTLTPSRPKGRSVGYEHFYNGASRPETYWAMLCAIANGGRVFDAPINPHLNMLAQVNVPGLGDLWDWTLRMFSYEPQELGFWIGRDTVYPAPGNGWEHGYPGPWVRGKIELNAEVGSLNSPLYASAPDILRNTIFGRGGIGKCNDVSLIATTNLTPGDYDITVVWAPMNATNWQIMKQQTTLSSPMNLSLAPGPCWVHAVIFEPKPGDVPPPPPGLEEIEKDLEALTLRVDEIERDVGELSGTVIVNAQHISDLIEMTSDLATVVGIHASRLDALETQLAAESLRNDQQDGRLDVVDVTVLALEESDALQNSTLEVLSSAVQDLDVKNAEQDGRLDENDAQWNRVKDAIV